MKKILLITLLFCSTNAYGYFRQADRIVMSIHDPRYIPLVIKKPSLWAKFKTLNKKISGKIWSERGTITKVGLLMLYGAICFTGGYVYPKHLNSIQLTVLK